MSSTPGTPPIPNWESERRRRQLARIGGGWPVPDTERCDWCDEPTPEPQDQHRVDIDSNTWWLCRQCYAEAKGTIG